MFVNTRHVFVASKMILVAAASDTTHRGKEVVLLFNKDTGEALNIACNTESDVLHQSERFQLRCLELQPDAAHTNYVDIFYQSIAVPINMQTDFGTAVVDNIDK